MRRRSFLRGLLALAVAPIAAAKFLGNVAARPIRRLRCRWYIDTCSIEDFLPPKGPERDAFEKDLQDRMAKNASRDVMPRYAGTRINPDYYGYGRITV